MDLTSYRWRWVYILFHSPYDVIMQHDRVQSPAFVRTRDLLPHGGKKALGIKEACHPEYVWSAIEYPRGKLVISF